MNRSDWMQDEQAALFTDLYQLTMLQAYFQEEMDETAVFDLFVRRSPGRNFLLACGLDTILHYLETLHFSEESIGYLDQQGQFSTDFLDYLRAFRFTGDVYAVREGTPVFPEEPIVEVVAPIGEAQLVETFLLNQITFQTGIASKVTRVVHAARDRTVADFGMRRMHGADAALKGARAGYIAGLDSTSNVLAGQLYGIPITGTMAHSYVEAHPTEMDAFRKFGELYPETTLLIDTYDTLEGVRKVIALAEEWGDEFAIGALRLDSGDLAELAHASRKLLDNAGLSQVKLFASGSLDEHRITELLDDGAPIDGFGVGTRMGTMADRPYLDTAYKLSSYAGTPRMKLSTAKSNLPGRKQVYRVYENGTPVRDVITTTDEELDEGAPLLERVMQDGKRTEAGHHSLNEARAHAEQSVSNLPDRLRRLSDEIEPYPVELSANLEQRRDETRQALEEKMGVQG